MNLRPGYKEDSVEVNLTPLIDVVFLLLIFFMVSTTFDRHAKLKVSLPEASTKATQQQNDPLVLSIDAKGNYFLNERQIVNQQLATLKQAILKTLGEKNLNIEVGVHLLLHGSPTYSMVGPWWIQQNSTRARSNGD